jgi:hypothetical protein
MAPLQLYLPNPNCTLLFFFEIEFRINDMLCFNRSIGEIKEKVIGRQFYHARLQLLPVEAFVFAHLG